MADFPSTIFIREPVIDGFTDIHKELWNDLYDEIEACQQAMGVTSDATYGSPKSGCASLAVRLDGFLSDGGRAKRQVKTYWHLDSTSVYHDLKGQVRQYIQVNRTARVASSYANAIAVTYNRAYSVAPQKILVQPMVDLSDAAYAAGVTSVESLRAFVLADTITTTGFSFKMRKATLSTGASVGIPTKPFYAFWMAIGGS